MKIQSPKKLFIFLLKNQINFSKVKSDLVRNNFHPKCSEVPTNLKIMIIFKKMHLTFFFMNITALFMQFF